MSCACLFQWEECDSDNILVMKWIAQNPDCEELTKEAKAHLLSMVSMDVQIDKVNRPLMVAVKTTASSLYKCYTGEKRLISYPEFI